MNRAYTRSFQSIKPLYLKFYPTTTFQVTTRLKMTTTQAPSSSSGPLTITSTLPLPKNSSSGSTIPRLGFGVYQSPVDVCYNSCLTALRAGYRNIDTAQYYGNEEQVGRAVRDSGVGRENVYISTKILGAKKRAKPKKASSKATAAVKSALTRSPSSSSSSSSSDEESKKDDEGYDLDATYDAVKGSVEKIGGGYVDLFLIHSPFSGAASRRVMWKALERAKADGLARAIGVSNYGKKYIEEMKAFATVWPPAVNQIELHPWCQQRPAIDYCTAHSIVIEAYCPVVRNRKADDATLLSIADKHSRKQDTKNDSSSSKQDNDQKHGRTVTTAQVLIRYSLQKGWVPLPKSDTPSRIEENADVFGGLELDGEDMARLDGLDEGEGGALVCAVEN